MYSGLLTQKERTNSTFSLFSLLLLRYGMDGRTDRPTCIGSAFDYFLPFELSKQSLDLPFCLPF